MKPSTRQHAHATGRYGTAATRRRRSCYAPETNPRRRTEDPTGFVSSLRVRLICVHDLGRPDFIWADQRSWRLSAMLLQPHSKHPTRPPELALVNMIDCRTDIESVSRVPGSGGSFHCTGDVCICASCLVTWRARVTPHTATHTVPLRDGYFTITHSHRCSFCGRHDVSGSERLWVHSEAC